MDADVQQQQRIIIKFPVAEGVGSAEIHHRLSAVFKSDTLSLSRVFEWHARFHSGRQSVGDNVRTGAPRTAITDQNISQVVLGQAGSCSCGLCASRNYCECSTTFMHLWVVLQHCTLFSTVTLNNASDYQANGLLLDYIGWTNGLSD